MKDLGAELVELDFNKPETVKNAFHGVDRVGLLSPLVEHLDELSKVKSRFRVE